MTWLIVSPEERVKSSSLPDKMAAILTDDIFKCIFLNENDRILIRISLKLSGWQYASIASGNGLAPTGDKPLPEPLLTQFTGAYMRH